MKNILIEWQRKYIVRIDIVSFTKKKKKKGIRNRILSAKL